MKNCVHVVNESGNTTAIREQLYKHAVSIAELAIEYSGSTEAVVLEVIEQIKRSLDQRHSEKQKFPQTTNTHQRVPTIDSWPTCDEQTPLS